MKKFGILLVLLTLVVAAVGVAGSQAQVGQRIEPEATPCRGLLCPEQPAAQRRVRKAKPARSAKAAKKQTQPQQAQQAQKKPALAERIPYTEQERQSAVIPGLPGVRFWADSVGAFSEALPPQKGPWLLLSSGGSAGAYGAGVLYGLSQSGKRPDFSVVTGVSIGAMMAPYAFLGQKYDDELRDSFLDLTSADVFEDSQRPDSLVDTWPLKDTLAKRVTPQVLEDIAAEHRKGRRLFVVTADLDSERQVVWNMGAIAAQGGDPALKLFRQVLLAASAIPGVFPPVLIDVEANGRKFQELHADGGVFGPFYVGPSSWLIDETSEQIPATQLYVLIHSKLTPEFDITGMEKIFIIGHTISAAVKAGAQAELALLSSAAKRDGIELNVASIESTFNVPAQTAFDAKQMKAMFELGVEQAKNGTAFRTQNKGASGQAQSKP